MEKRANIQLPVIAFVSGFVLMVFELAVARLLAPTLGSSVYVWTSVIGIVIAALSLGVWLGGNLADKRNARTDIVWLLISCSIAICFMLAASTGILDWLSNADYDQRIKGMLASLFLFAPTSFLIGTIGPYLAKFNVKSLETTGKSIANLDAMNAIGGIFGTFLTGFFLFALLGTRGIFFALILVLVGASWIIAPAVSSRKRVAYSVAAASIAFFSFMSTQRIAAMPAAIDTATAHYTVTEVMQRGQPIRLLSTGPRASQSGINASRPDKMIFWYTNELAHVVSVLNEPKTF